jgi:hypothetical protein
MIDDAVGRFGGRLLLRVQAISKTVRSFYP